MARSAPEVSFTVDSVDYGTIDVDGSSTWYSYNIYNPGNSTSFAEAINMSISFKESTNSAEAENESWVIVSCAQESGRIASVGGPETSVGSIVAGRARSGVSATIRTYVDVPAGATTAGQVKFLLHHRYQYTG